MCRYGLTTYKQHYACFACRKKFRHQLHHEDVKEVVMASDKKIPLVRHSRQWVWPESLKCPQCKGEMHSMGRDFKAPRKNDLKQWKKVEILFAHGFSYHSCGCCGPGLRPQELRDVDAFLCDNLPLSDGERLLKKIESNRRKQMNSKSTRQPQSRTEKK